MLPLGNSFAVKFASISRGGVVYRHGVPPPHESRNAIGKRWRLWMDRKFSVKRTELLQACFARFVFVTRFVLFFSTLGNTIDDSKPANMANKKSEVDVLREVWEDLLPFLDVGSLGSLATSAKALRELVRPHGFFRCYAIDLPVIKRDHWSEIVYFPEVPWSTIVHPEEDDNDAKVNIALAKLRQAESASFADGVMFFSSLAVDCVRSIEFVAPFDFARAWSWKAFNSAAIPLEFGECSLFKCLCRSAWHCVIMHLTDVLNACGPNLECWTLRLSGCPAVLSQYAYYEQHTLSKGQVKALLHAVQRLRKLRALDIYTSDMALRASDKAASEVLESRLLARVLDVAQVTSLTLFFHFTGLAGLSDCRWYGPERHPTDGEDFLAPLFAPSSCLRSIEKLAVVFDAKGAGHRYVSRPSYTKSGLNHKNTEARIARLLRRLSDADFTNLRCLSVQITARDQYRERLGKHMLESIQALHKKNPNLKKVEVTGIVAPVSVGVTAGGSLDYTVL